MLDIAAFEIIHLVEVIIRIFNIVGGVITIIRINYFGEALVLSHVYIGISDNLWVSGKLQDHLWRDRTSRQRWSCQVGSAEGPGM